MIVMRTMSSDYLSNSYMVGDIDGGSAVLIDSGGPPEPTLEAIEAHDLTVTHLILTHHHVDHVLHNDLFVGRFACPILAHRTEAELLGQSVDGFIEDGDELTTGGLRIRAALTPGHTVGMLALIINDECVFTGDTLFAGTVGGTMAPGHGTFADIQHSIMGTLMKLPPETVVHPGHTDPTTIGDEWEKNPFVRIWRGLDEPGNSRCTAFGRPATLVLRAPDYDGGTKCWVRFDDSGADEIAPGSQVVDE